MLDDEHVFSLVRDKFLKEQWSPEQIEGRLALELGGSPVSDTTIYRGISGGLFDGCIGGRKAKRRLRHRGKRRRGPSERRGKIKVSHEISERPAAADERGEPGHWEGDTVAGKAGGACLLTLVDRKDGFFVGGKCRRKTAKCIRDKMPRALEGQPHPSSSTAARSSPTMPGSRTRSESSSTSRCPTTLGSAARTRTPTASCGSTSRRASRWRA